MNECMKARTAESVHHILDLERSPLVLNQFQNLHVLPNPCLLLLPGFSPLLLPFPILLTSKMFLSAPQPPSFCLYSQWVGSEFCPQNFLPIALLSVLPSQSYASCGKSKYRKMTTCTLMLVRMSSLYSAKCLPRGSLKDT